jgi:molecular chaperone DnaK
MEGGTTTPLHLVETVTRADLEKMVADLIERTKEPMKKALADAGITAKDIDEVVLVGGMTRMPKVRETVKDFFGKEPHTGVNPTRSSPWARRSRPACCRATSRTCCCST